MSKIVFKKLENGKYSFFVEGNPHATAFLLKNTIKHQIKESGLFYAKKALEDLLQKYDPTTVNTEEDDNIVIKLNEYVQMRYGTSPSYSKPVRFNQDNFRVELNVETSEMAITEFGFGRNQRLARKDAAKKVAKRFNII